LSRKKILLVLILLFITAGIWTWVILKARMKPLIRYQPDKAPVHIERVILITIDTLRADHLGVYGYPRPTSPFIDSLALKSIVFQKAFCSISSTAPSHASIMTSLHPLTHKVLKNGHKLDKSFLTLAEVFQEIKFKTAAFASTSTHFKAGNIDQGFSIFNEPSKKSSGHRRPADQTADQAIQWLKEKNPSDAFFLWVHFFDPHDPYIPVPEYRKGLMFPSDRARQEYIRFLKEEQNVDPAFYKNDNQMVDVIEQYDAEVLFVDHQIRRLYEFMDRKGLNLHTLWIITADHGEGLGSHRWAGHSKHIYNEQVRVPLLFHFTDQVPAQGSRWDGIVEQVDIMPTLLSLFGCTITRYQYRIHGTSFASLLLNDGKGFPQKYAFSQRRHYSLEKRPEQIVPEETNYEEGEKYCLQDLRYKYILRTTGEHEFYNVHDDPYEMKNLIRSSLPEKDQMKQLLSAMIEQFKQGSKLTPKSVNKETVEKLKSLGYVQ